MASNHKYSVYSVPRGFDVTIFAAAVLSIIVPFLTVITSVIAAVLFMICGSWTTFKRYFKEFFDEIFGLVSWIWDSMFVFYEED